MSKNNELEQLSLNKKPSLLANLISKNTTPKTKTVPIEIPVMNNDKVGNNENAIQAVTEALEQPIKLPSQTTNYDQQTVQAMTQIVDESSNETGIIHNNMSRNETGNVENKAVQLPSFDNENNSPVTQSLNEKVQEDQSDHQQTSPQQEQSESVIDHKAIHQTNESLTENRDKGDNKNIDQAAPSINHHNDEIPNKESIPEPSSLTPSHIHLAATDILQSAPQPIYDMERLSRQHHTFLQKLHKHQQKIDALLHEANQLYDKRNQLMQKLTSNNESNDLKAPVEKPATSIENKLYQSKLDVQGIACDLVVQYAEKIRENIYNNSAESKRLLSPLQTSCELLQTKVDYTVCLEEAVTTIAEHKDLKRQENRIQSALNFLQDCLKDFEPSPE